MKINNKQNKSAIYGSYAKYYDILYSFIDYKKETEAIVKLIKNKKRTSGKKLLEVACGTGNYTVFLAQYFDTTGSDVSPDMIRLAKKKTKDADFIIADMQNFSTKTKFEIIACLASSIGYLKNYSELKKTISNFARHISPGGLLVIEPTQMTLENYKAGTPYCMVHNGQDIKIARLTVAKKSGITAILQDHFLVAERNKSVISFQDTNKLAMFDQKKFIQIMQESGFETSVEMAGKKTVLVGIKQ